MEGALDGDLKQRSVRGGRHALPRLQLGVRGDGQAGGQGKPCLFRNMAVRTEVAEKG